ncbi:DUF3429 domain-containing protein [Halomonas nitroreducens]|uniref:DUF3429 domain-containing protein n=1 Tax=Halomonas nitroreducens TaxID=447425 RepID=A0A3S0I7X9_9GAMM|nr:DUF3429 domain-containing protein [Halomonas nitroreducens]RTR03816.1 DUF3429 domain-containing protein [Halomonas nitroreducens]
MTVVSPDPWPRWLGLAGLLPFVASLAAAWWGPPPWQGVAIHAFLGYAAVILSFLGGVHWGLALGTLAPGSVAFRRRLGMAVLPSLVAWSALLLEPLPGTWLLVAGFVLLRAFEVGTTGLPAWYRRLRSALTLGVVACHLLLILGVLLLA